MIVHAITTLASEIVDTGTEVTNNERIVTIDEYWLNLVISFFLPVVVALVTKRFAAGSVKAVVLLFLAAVTGVLTSIQAAGGHFYLESTITGLLISFAMAVTSHFGLWSPAMVTGRDGSIQLAVQGGIGRDTAHP